MQCLEAFISIGTAFDGRLIAIPRNQLFAFAHLNQATNPPVGAAYPNPRRTDMDKATPTPSPASVDSFMSLLRNHENRISETYGVLQDRRIPSEEVRAAIDASSEARNALIAEVERLAAQAAPIDYYAACEQQNIALLSAMGYPHEKDTLISPEEYAADLKRKADLFDALAQLPVVQAVRATHTTGHCKEHAKPGGCQLHNLHCGWPDCDRRPIEQSAAQSPAMAKD